MRCDAKALGAYYTDSHVADFLVRWAIRSPSDRVLDPSFGGGVFLLAGAERVRRLGGDPARQVYGIELSEAAFQAFAEQHGAYEYLRLYHGDFFDYTGTNDLNGQSALPNFDAVVGNPPFIRYQRFAGAARRKALRCAASEGVRLTQLASSWAPFVIHGASMINDGGRLAMVVPYEIVHARYAKAVLHYLARQFSHIAILTFEEPLFPDLNESTVLLLADGEGRSGCDVIEVKHYKTASELREGASTEAKSLLIETRDIIDDKQRFAAVHLPPDYLELYAAAKTFCIDLGSIADVGIGYVTGANEFFHISPKTQREFELPDEFLTPAVCRGAALRGLLFTQADWADSLSSGSSAYLLKIEHEEVPPPVRAYLDTAAQLGVPNRYKCRSRKPWFRVPHVYTPDALLTYMSSDAPKLVANVAGVVAPNTLHVVRMKDQCCPN